MSSTARSDFVKRIGEEMQSANVPPGFLHVLLCTGKERKEVYRGLYFILKKAGIGGQVKTFVYPDWIRQIIRERFGGDGGAYDHQFVDRPDTHLVTVGDLEKVAWRAPPKSCLLCSKK